MSDFTDRIFGSRGLPPRIEDDAETEFRYAETEFRYPEAPEPEAQRERAEYGIRTEMVEVPMAPDKRGVIQIGKFLVTPSGIEDYERTISDEELVDALRWALKTADSVQWLIGDLAQIANEKLSEWYDLSGFSDSQKEGVYQMLIERTGYSYSSVTKFAHFVRIFPFSDRRKRLTYSHHVEVAALDKANQEYYLDLAERGRGGKPLTVRELRALVAIENGVDSILKGLSRAQRSTFAARLRALAEQLEREE